MTFCFYLPEKILWLEENMTSYTSEEKEKERKKKNNHPTHNERCIHGKHTSLPYSLPRSLPLGHLHQSMHHWVDRQSWYLMIYWVLMKCCFRHWHACQTIIKAYQLPPKYIDNISRKIASPWYVIKKILVLDMSKKRLIIVPTLFVLFISTLFIGKNKQLFEMN